MASIMGLRHDASEWRERANRELDAYRDQVLREAAAKLRAWGEDGEKRRDLGQAQSPFYMWEDADSAADLIDPDQEQR